MLTLLLALLPILLKFVQGVIADVLGEALLAPDTVEVIHVQGPIEHIETDTTDSIIDKYSGLFAGS